MARLPAMGMMLLRLPRGNVGNASDKETIKSWGDDDSFAQRSVRIIPRLRSSVHQLIAKFVIGCFVNFFSLVDKSTKNDWLVVATLSDGDYTKQIETLPSEFASPSMNGENTTVIGLLLVVAKIFDDMTINPFAIHVGDFHLH